MATEGSGEPTQPWIPGNIRVSGSQCRFITEMTDLIMAQRAYQLNSRMIQTVDEMEKQANNLRG